MVIEQPQATDYLNSPDHAALHRIIAADTGATAQTIIVNANSNVGINESSPTARLDITVDNNDNVGGLIVDQNDTTNNPRGITVENAGTGDGLYLDQNGNGLSLNIDTEATTASVVQIYADVMTSGEALYARAESSSFSGNIARFKVSHSSSTGTCLYLHNNGVREALSILNYGIIETGYAGINIYSDAAQTTGSSLAIFFLDDSSSSIPVIKIQNDGSGDGLFIDHNNINNAINIDMDANSDSHMKAVKIAVDNAGSGLEFAFDFDSASLERSAGTETTTKNIRVMDSGGSEYYLKIYSVA